MCTAETRPFVIGQLPNERWARHTLIGRNSNTLFTLTIIAAKEYLAPADVG